MLQALKLAEYRPVIDVNHLPENLQRVEKMASDAQRLFNKTRSRLVYYEDLVMDSQVGALFSANSRIGEGFSLHSLHQVG